MKKIFFAVVAVAFTVAFTSCGGGWTPETKESSHKICMIGMEISYPDDAKSICDCYVNKLVEKYPKADFTPEQNTAIMDECSADAKKKADEAFDKKMDEMMNSAEETMTEGTETAGEAAAGAVEEVKKEAGH
jgi:hypothetical protein